MTVPITSPDPIEQDRLRLVDELATESGVKWVDGYRPGSPGCHELLDRTSLVADMLERHLLAHPACVANPAWYAMAEQAATTLRELYQQIGARHLAAEERSESDRSEPGPPLQPTGSARG
jgi:hypothetical protein